MKNRNPAAVLVTGLVCSLMTVASPVWAHDKHHYAYAPRHIHRDHLPALVMAPATPYGYATAPVYYVPPRAYAPAYEYRPVPAYAPPPANYARSAGAYMPLGTIGGAIAGAALGSAIGQGNDRVAAITIGSVVGAVIGNRMTAGR